MFNWFKRPIPQPPLVIPPGEGQICLDCESTFPWRARIKIDGIPRCPACGSQQMIPLFNILKYVHQHAHLRVVQKQAEPPRPVKNTDNLSYFLTDFEGPRPTRKSKPVTPPEEAA